MFRRVAQPGSIPWRRCDMSEHPMTGLTQDFCYSLRQLRRNPGFAFTSILILALGMCASVAIFGFVDATLIKPLPYSNPSQLVMVTESVTLFPRANLSYPDYLDWKKL